MTDKGASASVLAADPLCADPLSVDPLAVDPLSAVPLCAAAFVSASTSVSTLVSASKEMHFVSTIASGLLGNPPALSNRLKHTCPISFLSEETSAVKLPLFEIWA